MMEMTNKDIMALMNDAHNVFFKKYRDMELTRDSPEWDSIIADANKLMEKYQKFTHMAYVRGGDGKLHGETAHTANAIILWMLEMLERRCAAEGNSAG